MAGMFGRFAVSLVLSVYLLCHSALAAPKVTVTIKPVHALVAGVMGQVGSPGLIWDGAATPHGGHLKPSQIALIETADVIFYVSDTLEVSLHDSLAARGAAGAAVQVLMDAPGLVKHRTRKGGVWVDKSGNEDADSPMDPHIWLDPHNARAVVSFIAGVLAKADPDNAETYHANAADMIIQLNALGREITARLTPVRERPFIVFHDAYQYFERRFGLNGAGTVTIDPERAPGARRLKSIRDQISARGIACVFAEPQFEVGYVRAVIEGSGARMAVLDPLGVAVPAGSDAYVSMLRTLADAVADCLGGDPPG